MVGALGRFFAVADRLQWFDRQRQKPESEEILRNADMALDRRRWTKARDLYAEHLAQNPSHAAIWVQYGHSLKESGDLDSAEKAYRRSLALASEIADTHLQLGHLLKIRENKIEAIAQAIFWSFRCHAARFDLAARPSLPPTIL